MDTLPTLTYNCLWSTVQFFDRLEDNSIALSQDQTQNPIWGTESHDAGCECKTSLGSWKSKKSRDSFPSYYTKIKTKTHPLYIKAGKHLKGTQVRKESRSENRKCANNTISIFRLWMAVLSIFRQHRCLIPSKSSSGHGHVGSLPMKNKHKLTGDKTHGC